ncbi:MAG: hypothetical protein DWI61_01560 [Chloroflexi bacterium]|nr:MAG: hypothetical protein DWI61_01560 [Chloroflexota bacterium]
MPAAALLATFGLNAMPAVRAAESPTIAIADVTALESGGIILMPVTLTNSSGASASVTYTVTAGTATAGADFTAGAGTVQWQAGESGTKYILVQLLADSTAEPEEVLYVSLADATNATISRSRAALNITDSSSTTVGALAAGSVSEGAGTATVSVTWTGYSTATVTATYTTADGSALAGSDYTATSGTLTWSGGETGTKTFAVPIIDDTDDEPDQQFTVSLSSVVSSVVTRSTAAMTIVDNDVTPTLAVAAASVLEGAGNATISVIMTGTSTATVTVVATATSGTALAGSDFTATSSTLTWSAGQSGAKIFTVPILSDLISEAAETFSIVLSAASNATAGSAGTVTVTDAPLLSISATSIAENYNTGYAEMSVTLTGNSTQTVSVAYATSDGTATVVQDYRRRTGTLTWGVGESGAKTFNILVVDDTVREDNETVYVTFSNVLNAVMVTDSVTLTIVDNDGQSASPGVAVADAVIVTETSGTTVVTEGGATDVYYLQLAQQPTSSVSIAIGTSAQLSVSPTQVWFNSVNFSTPVSITVTAVDDAVGEGLHTARITHTITSADTRYNNAGVRAFTISINDNDAGISIVQSGGSTAVTEGASTGDTYAVSLVAAPTQTVQLAVNVGSQLTASPASLTFTSSNYATPQIVTLTAVDDALVEGTHTAAVTHTVTSSDSSFNGLVLPTLDVVITDNDSRVVIAQSGSDTRVKEGLPAGDSYTVRLTTAPTSTVVINIATLSSDISVSPASLLFTAANYASAQTVTVKAVSDMLVEGQELATITHSVASADSTYAGAAVNNVVVFVMDREGAAATKIDFDGDGLSDIGVYRPTTGQWIVQLSGSGNGDVVVWGLAGSTDVPVPGDYDGDGVTDRAVFRNAFGQWFIKQSSDGTGYVVTWGVAGGKDIPAPADFDGDGKTDLVVYRPSTGQWFVKPSTTGVAIVFGWGLAGGNDIPVPADFDGDGRADYGIYRPSTSQWYLRLSSSGATSVTLWGTAGSADIPLPRDYDGDAVADIAVFMPASAQWVVRRSSDMRADSITWGVAGGNDLPVPEDYDGDGKADLAVYQVNTARWFVRRSSDTRPDVLVWGIANSTDYPVQAPDFNADGTAYGRP